MLVSGVHFFTAILTSTTLGLISGPLVIEKLKLYNPTGNPIRIDGPKSHIISKKNTPAMGGIIILFALILSSLAFVKLNPMTTIVLFTTIAYAFIGGMDDIKKITLKTSTGISARHKLIMQALASMPAAIFFAYINKYIVIFPFGLVAYLSYFYILYAMIIIVSVVNAVNLTDGLDGLVSVPLIIAVSCFAFFSYTTENINICILGACFIGSIIAFLWFNAYPAKIFMGDMGSLAAGGFLSTIALTSKKEILLIPICAIFIVEVCSVIIQVSVYKKTKKRFFLMAPIHHHFEQKGIHEVTIVKRFWLISLLCAIASIIIWYYGY
ncbi:Phospho-N-acetylmuramoyl-pentapeptide-transferase [Candidatus Xenohaliotis californiensis]|uniref:Phospho-N-acetylmuramoyl-pentapeptide-transferase n=1 Tax=Candidatus Xenohaliotis californiensis TaxID=84677 RepID=A0ABM9N8W4_9RICK|nr:Phospho-N-acetylmuramoyl-pentapeptide-transferase [Candidatus Xenohaliotis californiensis]